MSENKYYTEAIFFYDLLRVREANEGRKIHTRVEIMVPELCERCGTEIETGVDTTNDVCK